MAWITVNGIGLAYEIIGDGERTVAITPGGRHSKDTAGIRELAHAIAAAGYKVLIWDRPNAGESDLCFDGPSEGLMAANALAGLLRALDFGKTLLLGGSAGSRQSLLVALRHPELVAGLFLFWVSGGPVGLSVAALFYCGNSAIAAARGGMESVAALPMYQESLERNAGNRARLLDQDRDAFIAQMQRWSAAFFPDPGSPVPGHTSEELAKLDIPVMILRNDEYDQHHTAATTAALAQDIPSAQLVDPAWGPDEWLRRLDVREQTGEDLFSQCPLLANQAIAFFDQIA